jgi:predicted MFS family arabinose efflux permease
MTIAIRGAPAGERGAVVGTFTAFFDLSFGLGAVSSGAIAAMLGFSGAFVAAALVSFAGFATLLFRGRRNNPRELAAASMVEG